MSDTYNATLRATGRAAFLIASLTALAMLAACASPQPKAMVNTSKSKEYFAESEYGVKASPRVSTKRSRLPRGGGRDQTGKPYQVRGNWYYPKEDRDYRKIGAASWYGDAFHGRLTANGEIYDMTHLTGAHPTMPLPSYARVTNTANGNSVVVRVNDRGPFAHGRIIDLSKQAAEMLDYTSAGVAKVQVEYVGRAPLHGRDDQYLMASYRPGGRGPARDQADEIAPQVMIAMNGPTPISGFGASPAGFPGQAQTVSTAHPVLPALGPIAPERPMTEPFAATLASAGSMVLSYADYRVGSAARAVAAFSEGAVNADALVESWQRRGVGEGFIAAGTFASREGAEHHRDQLASLGSAAIETVDANGVLRYSVTLHPDGRKAIDEMLQATWATGALEAFVVRD